MKSAQTTTRWLAFILAVFCVGAVHHAVCNASPDKAGLLWWVGNGNTWLLSTLVFGRLANLDPDMTLRLLWPAMGYVYYTFILLPVFDSPLNRGAGRWAKAAILPAFHLALGLTAWVMNSRLGM